MMHAIDTTHGTADALSQGAPSAPVLGPAMALAVSVLLIACFLFSAEEKALPATGWAAAFLLIAAHQDLSDLRIPNWLTLPALCVGILLGAMEGGVRGAGISLMGAGTALAIFFIPFAMRWFGAGDVKAAMVLGSLWGSADFLAALIWMVVTGGLLAIVMVTVRGDLVDLLRRWGRSAVATVVRRRVTYFAPEDGATTGLPFAVAMVLGAAGYQLWGMPWI
jgi:prepilin peptidase CpaA